LHYIVEMDWDFRIYTPPLRVP